MLQNYEYLIELFQIAKKYTIMFFFISLTNKYKYFRGNREDMMAAAQSSTPGSNMKENFADMEVGPTT